MLSPRSFFYYSFNFMPRRTFVQHVAVVIHDQAMHVVFVGSVVQHEITQRRWQLVDFFHVAEKTIIADALFAAVLGAGHGACLLHHRVVYARRATYRIVPRGAADVRPTGTGS